jgi:hypothetical protein
MTSVMGAVLAALLALVLLTPGAAAQDTGGFRFDGEPDPLGRRGPAIAGWLYNDNGFGVTNVRVRVDVLDGGGGVVGTGEGWVYGNVPALGRAYFFVQVPRYGASYRIGVVRYDRVESP